MIRRLHCFALLLVPCFLVSSLHGNMVNYGNFSGNTVDFSNVMENSTSPLPLFGAPTVMGDTLDFDVPGFTSQSTAGGVDFLTGQLSFTVTATGNNLLDSISILEFGSYFGFGDDSVSSVAGSAWVQIGNQIYNGNFAFQNDGTGSGTWSDNFVINFPDAQQVTFYLDNSLFTLADASGAAFIDKRGVLITANTVSTAIPEPTALLLGIPVLAGICLRRNRRA